MSLRPGRRARGRFLRHAAFLVAIAAVSAMVATLPGAPAVGASAPTAARAAGLAPGAPGEPPTWAGGDKSGFGTSRTLESKVWYTLANGGLAEIFYPRIDTPSTRDTMFVVTDGRTFTDREDLDTVHTVSLVDPAALIYRQVDTAKSGRYRIIKTYVTDPARSSVLVDVDFVSLSGKPYQVYVLHDPQLNNDGSKDTGWSSGGSLVATDGTVSAALASYQGFTKTSSGYLGRSDGWQDLARDHRMDWSYRAATPGNVVQLARTRLTGLVDAQQDMLVLGFGASASQALATARASVSTTGFSGASEAYAKGWHDYLATLAPPPASADRWRTEYAVSAMVLAASEDKTYRGGFVAAPNRPWAWSNVLKNLPVYHEVWSRDLYQIATGLLAAGDRAAANRALDYLFRYQERPDGSYPQNSRLSGEPVFTGLQMDEVALPIVLASQLGRTSASDWDHVRRSANFLVAKGPYSPQERWENLAGYSPSTIAAEIAGLVCAADIARRNGALDDEKRYLALADAWRLNLDQYTVTHNGPYSPKPYFLRVSADGNADAATQIQVSDGGPLVDQRRVVDPSFLELVRLGVLRADDPRIVNTLAVVDAKLGYSTANGPFWHRASFDGYGEKRDGSQWEPVPTGSGLTLGRGWPLLTGERGEYRLAAGSSAQTYLDTMARAADDQSLFLPEQVWDHRAPAGPSSGARPGEPTRSAMPLAWTHAQFLRLAWSIEAGQPVETPQLVACRYGSTLCRG